MKKQQSLFKTKQVRGGTKSNSHLREARSLSTRKWLHIVHKSEKAKGSWSLRGYHAQTEIQRIYYAKAKQYGVLVDKFSNNGNHIHAKIKIENRQLFKKFLIAVGGMVARLITKARKGKPTGNFWTSLPYIEICDTSAQILNLDGYIEANKVEAVFGRWAREIYLEWFREWVKSQKRSTA